MGAPPWTLAGRNVVLRLAYADKGKARLLRIYVLVIEGDDGRPCEFAIKADAVGSTIRGLLDVLGTTASLALARGATIWDVISDWRGTQFEPSGRVGQGQNAAVSSIVDAVARWLLTTYRPPQEEGKGHED